LLPSWDAAHWNAHTIETVSQNEVAVSTHLAKLFKQRRLDLDLRPGQVARRMGRTSPAGCANRICLFEQSGEIKSKLFDELQAALGISDEEVETALERDRRDHMAAFLEWRSQPTEPHLVVRAIPGFFFERQLPEGLESLEEMEQFAATFAKKLHKMVWLCPGTRRFTVRFDENGDKLGVVEATPDTMTTPWMKLAKGRKKFLFGVGDGGIKGIKMLDQPERPGPKGEETDHD